MDKGLLRSFLFVPADNEKLLRSAIAKPCDVVILDLEDGTHPQRKEFARGKLKESIKEIKAAKKHVAVRINGDLNTAVTDLRAAVQDGLDIVVLPKVEYARDVQLLSQLIGDLERVSNLQSGTVKFLIQIESAVAMPNLYEIAAADSRVFAMMLGSEDYSLDVGGLPTPEALFVPSMMVLQACRAAGIQPIGFIASIANLGEVDEFRVVLKQARELGFRGAVIVHPKFLEAVNDCYTATESEIKEAEEIVERFKEAQANGLGAIKVAGKMIDKPVYLRALETLGIK
ncbi:HpcH/HpaI aldolase/citrate lyase family protein [Polynucleobacter sinensis]|uniref:HpcH/HpaI aldolase/citrate lyase family protein n=1 Tax=Polynucleobacter sinensis TaxID=1743157 RepID=UPI000782DC04|nr:CoA ester lyase [Polynucleobacter sinensis]